MAAASSEIGSLWIFRCLVMLAGFDQLAVPTNIYAGIAKYPLMAIPVFVIVQAVIVAAVVVGGVSYGLRRAGLPSTRLVTSSEVRSKVFVAVTVTSGTGV